MSMHEFEDVVERSIRLIAASEATDAECRAMFSALYSFQGMFDTGFTNMRVMDILLTKRYAYKFALEDHPRYKENRDYFKKLAKAGKFDFVDIDPANVDGEDTRTHGYYVPPHLYCDAGSPLWAEMVRTGKLKGEDAVDPSDPPMPLEKVVSLACRLALASGDSLTLSMWHPLFLVYAVGFVKPAALPTFKDIPDVKDIRETLSKAKGQGMISPLNYGYLRLPDLAELEGDFNADQMAFTRWWMELEGAK